MKTICVTLVLLLVVAGVRSDRNSLMNVEQEDGKADETYEGTNEPVPQKIFKPEKEWKEVQPDGAIPKGLHVRINLQTGKKEAKLLDKNDDDEKISSHRLKEILKSVKNDGDKLNETDTSRFRDMDTIKKDFESLKLKPVESESHTIKELLTMFRNESSSTTDKRIQLKEMEYLLHQYDVAKDFVKMNGIPELLNALSDEQLRKDAALALGAALQGNPVVQQTALSEKAVPAILDALQQGCSSQCVFALSTLLRQFPRAQSQFVTFYGAGVLSGVFNAKESDEKIKLRIITLLSDLLVERTHAMTGVEGDDLKKVYQQVELKPQVVNSGFCDLIPRLLASSKEDVREKVLNALHSLVDDCHFDKLVPQLESLRSHYRFLMNEESITTPDEYYQGLYLLTDDLVKHITDENHKHSEL